MGGHVDDRIISRAMASHLTPRGQRRQAIEAAGAALALEGFVAVQAHCADSLVGREPVMLAMPIEAHQGDAVAARVADSRDFDIDDRTPGLRGSRVGEFGSRTQLLIARVVVEHRLPDAVETDY